MIYIFYTIAALVLYGISDYILESIEIKLGKRLPNRSLVFFAIISILAVSTFSLIEFVFDNPKESGPPENLTKAKTQTTTTAPKTVVASQQHGATDMPPANTRQVDASGNR